jgi:hypothetical protein
MVKSKFVIHKLKNILVKLLSGLFGGEREEGNKGGSL